MNVLGRWIYSMLWAMIALLASHGMAADAPTTAFPKSWYYHLDEMALSAIQPVLQQDPRFERLRLPEGYYFQDLRKVSKRGDVTINGLIDPVPFQLPNENGEYYMGFVSARFGDPMELWLITPKNQKFHLATFFPDTDKWTNTLFMQTPRYWFPVRDGVISFNEHAYAYRVKASKQDLGRPVISYDRDGEKQHLRAYFRRMPNKDAAEPVYFVHRKNNKMLMLAFAGGNDASPVQPIESIDPKAKLQVALVDIESGEAKTLPGVYQWPVSLSAQGIYYRDGSSLKFAEVDWRKNELLAPRTVFRFGANDDFISSGKSFFIKKSSANTDYFYTVSSTGRMTRYEEGSERFRVLNEVEEETLYEATSNVVDLKNELEIGLVSPLFSQNELTETLANSLDASRKTWAVIRYEDGQMPSEVVSSFVWELTTDMLPASGELRDVRRVFKIPGYVFDKSDDQEVIDMMANIWEVVNETKTILFLEDFPADKEFQTKRGNALQRLEVFWKTFESCIEAGTCRIVTTMQNRVYNEAANQLTGIFEDARVVEMPRFSKDQARDVALQHLTNLQAKRNKVLTPDAFDAFNKFVSNIGRTKMSPGNEIERLEGLFDYLETHHPHTTDVGREVVLEWMDYTRGINRLRERLDIDGLRTHLKDVIVSHDQVIDKVCDALKAVKYGTHLGEGPLAHFTFIGTTGTGKTYLAEQIAEYLTGKGSILKIDMSNFSGFGPDDPIYQEIKASKDKIRVVLFDDVDQIRGNKALMDKLAGIVESGIYGEGTADALSFSNTIVLWTANWGQHLIRAGNSSNLPLLVQLRNHLTQPQDGEEPMMEPKIWGRIETSINIMGEFETQHWLELGIIMTREYSRELEFAKGIKFKVDPRIILEISEMEAYSQAGARSIKNRLRTQVFPIAAEYTAKDGVDRIVMVQAGRSYSVLTNLDGARFENAWRTIPDVSGWDAARIEACAKDVSQCHD